MTNKLIACAIFIIVALMMVAIIRGMRREPENINPDGSYEGVQRLKYLCFLFALVSLFSAIANINIIAGRADPHTLKFDVSLFFTWYSRFYAAFNCLVATALGYSVHKRVRIGWKLGWVLMILIYVKMVLSAVYDKWRYELASDLQNLQILLVSVIGFIVCAYWGKWWSRQKGYFEA